jgi:tetratricopeptide (TPR) repeat protein
MKKKICSLTIFATIALITALFAGCAKPIEKMTAAELLDLGEKFLLEMNYEQAVICFEKLIEVEPRNPRGYTGLAQAYIALGKQDKAIEILRKGISVLPDDPTIRAVLDELAPSSDPASQLKSALAPLATKLIELWQASDYETALAEIRTVDFNEALTSQTNGEAIIFSEFGDIGCGFYLVKDAIFIYIGEYDGAARNGNGSWLHVNLNNSGYYMFSGAWNQDKPNGNGESISVRDESVIEKQEGKTYALTVTTEGTYSDGLVNGPINEQWVMDSGHTHNWNFIAVDGRYQVVGSTDWSDSVVAFCTECNADLSNDSINGVRGFTD